ncbi:MULTISPECIES: protease inhibitor I42 family protein [Inquilinus]|uniref:Proteinase inhibitor I42 chagasin domain-containing protein n=1 Tax=Inquilinus ginsengisoli TaxID=363840 RepID=A0ABU1JRC1_9PROT|nr:protease inhibitor I42 family protein [Inquilinus ginsengisoli]MDR6291166.1 hypothetical protein [Inquilinus ginsengisoli]
MSRSKLIVEALILALVLPEAGRCDDVELRRSEGQSLNATVKIGDSIVIAVDAASGINYDWVYDIVDNRAGIWVVKDPEVRQSEEETPGAPETKRFFFGIRNRGCAILHFMLRSPDYDGAKIADQFRAEICGA